MSYCDEYKPGDLVHVWDSRCLGCIVTSHVGKYSLGTSYSVYIVETGTLLKRVYAEEMNRVLI